MFRKCALRPLISLLVFFGSIGMIGCSSSPITGDLPNNGDTLSDGDATLTGDALIAGDDMLAVCGNGTTEPGEECDDGNTDPCDGCAECTNHVNVCGDSYVCDDEECDDGNSEPFDACQNTCIANDLSEFVVNSTTIGSQGSCRVSIDNAIASIYIRAASVRCDALAKRSVPPTPSASMPTLAIRPLRAFVWGSAPAYAASVRMT